MRGQRNGKFCGGTIAAPSDNDMPHLKLRLNCTLEQQPAIEEALEALGALAVTLADAHADAPDEQAIFEPGVGEMPLWGEIALEALFEADADEDALHEALADRVPEQVSASVEFEEVPDQDWERAWMDQFKPMAFGRRTWVYPWNIEPPADPELAIIRLDPGLAFGSGTHPTTALCLEWLDGLDLGGKTVLDFGCGSGVLALAALKLGAESAVGVDNDPQALTATADNAERNGVGDRLKVYAPEDEPTAQYPVVVANILATALEELEPLLAARTAPGGLIAMSGILDGQEDDLLHRYAPDFTELRVDRREEWVRISGRRR
jgi:ribosomal protein L11 methyltransferase